MRVLELSPTFPSLKIAWRMIIFGEPRTQALGVLYSFAEIEILRGTRWYANMMPNLSRQAFHQSPNDRSLCMEAIDRNLPGMHIQVDYCTQRLTNQISKLNDIPLLERTGTEWNFSLGLMGNQRSRAFIFHISLSQSGVWTVKACLDLSGLECMPDSNLN